MKIKWRRTGYRLIHQAVDPQRSLATSSSSGSFLNPRTLLLSSSSSSTFFPPGGGRRWLASAAGSRRSSPAQQACASAPASSGGRLRLGLLRAPNRRRPVRLGVALLRRRPARLVGGRGGGRVHSPRHRRLLLLRGERLRPPGVHLRSAGARRRGVQPSHHSAIFSQQRSGAALRARAHTHLLLEDGAALLLRAELVLQGEPDVRAQPRLLPQRLGLRAAAFSVGGTASAQPPVHCASRHKTQDAA